MIRPMPAMHDKDSRIHRDGADPSHDVIKGSKRAKVLMRL